MIYAFQSDPAIAKINVKPSGLSAQTLYERRSADKGVLGVVKRGPSAMGLYVLSSPAAGAAMNQSWRVHLARADRWLLVWLSRTCCHATCAWRIFIGP